MKSLYIETTIVSFLRENRSAAPGSVQLQETTKKWWDGHRHRYELVTAQYVIDEAKTGNAALVADRLKQLRFCRWAIKLTNWRPKWSPGQSCRWTRSSTRCILPARRLIV